VAERPPLFVLDQNFPMVVPIEHLFPNIMLRQLRDIHPDLIRDHEDWEVMRELKVRGGVDGWITLDRGMHQLEKEMSVLHQSRLSLVVFEGVDNDPIVAAGLLLIHLPTIAVRLDRSKPQLWILRKPTTRPPINPWDQLSELARRLKLTTQEVYDRNKLPSTTFLRGR
jgi:hypothetical protein